MKFLIVNHRFPRCDRHCTECSRSLGPGYVRDVVTRKGYCNYDCYRHRQLRKVAFPFFSVRANCRPEMEDLVPLGFIALLATASCWFQIGAASISWIDAVASASQSHMAERPPSA